MSEPIKRLPLASVEETENLEKDSYILIVQNGETFKMATSKIFDEELSLDSSNPISNKAVAEAVFGDLLKTKIVYNDEDVEEKLVELTENLSKLTPMLMIAGYDATESLGVGDGEGLVILDSGDGDIENAIIIPYIPCDRPFTQQQEKALEKCKEFVERYEKGILWKQLSDYSGGKNKVDYATFSDLTSFNDKKPRYIKADIVSTGDRLQLYIDGSFIILTRADFSDVLEENENQTLHLEIEPGEGFYLFIITCYGSGGIKTVTETLSSNSDYIRKLTIATDSSNTIEVTNAFGRG